MRTRRQQLRLPDEVRYIQRRAAAHDGRAVAIGQFVLFSTETGDAWLLDIRHTETTCVVAWLGKYPIEGRAFVYADRGSRRVSTILGCPVNPAKQHN